MPPLPGDAREEATPYPLAQGQVLNHAGEYLGFTARETGGTAGVSAILYDGTSASGPILEEINLAANGKDDANYPRPGRLVTTGIFCQVSGTGVLAGSVFA